MNVPNLLTFLRIVLVPLFMVLALKDMPYGDFLAALVFSLAAITDFFDGHIARKNKLVTKLGALIDPVADKLLISGALLCLVQLGRVHALLAMVILAREFAVMGLRLIAASSGVTIKVSKFGKLKTTSQFASVIALLLNLPFGSTLMYLTAIITIISGAEYFVKGAHVFKE